MQSTTHTTRRGAGLLAAIAAAATLFAAGPGHNLAPGSHLVAGGSGWNPHVALNSARASATQPVAGGLNQNPRVAGGLNQQLTAAVVPGNRSVANLAFQRVAGGSGWNPRAQRVAGGLNQNRLVAQFQINQ